MRRTVIFAALSFVLLLGTLPPGVCKAQVKEASRPDLNAFIQETQKTSTDTDKLDFVWWIPEEYWRLVFSDDPTMTEASIDELVGVLEPYTVFAVVVGKLGPIGGPRWTSEENVRASIALKDDKGRSYTVLSAEQIDPDAANLMHMMRPVLANILGPMGENMHFYLFPRTRPDGTPIWDTRAPGRITLALGQSEYTWRLPLGSLLPPKTCPVCGAQLSGAYNYCPWDGTKLPESE